MYKSIRISAELHKKLKVYCAEHGMTMAGVIKRALENKGIVTFTINPNDKTLTGINTTQTISTNPNIELKSSD